MDRGLGAEHIVHLAVPSDWESAATTGSYPWSTRGLTFEEVGFVHCARVGQVEGVASCDVSFEDGTATVELLDGETGVAPGQACVLYSDPGSEARVWGGGFIARSEREETAEAMLRQLEAV